MDTPNKYKLCLLNTRNKLVGEKVNKTFDTMRLVRSNLNEVTLEFYLNRSIIHFINLTRLIENIKIEMENPKVIISFFTGNASKDIFIHIDLNNAGIELFNRTERFLHRIKKSHFNSLNRKEEKLKYMPKRFISKRSSLTPINKLSDPSYSSTKKKQFKYIDSQEIRKKLLFLSDTFSTPEKSEKDLQSIILTPPKAVKPSSIDSDNSIEPENKTNSKDLLRRSLENQKIKNIINRAPSPATTFKNMFVSSQKNKLEHKKAFANDSTPDKSQHVQRSTFSGFTNLGNTCYMNVVMQSLLASEIFRETLKEFTRKNKKFLQRESIIYEVIVVLKHYIHKRNINLINLKNKICEKNPDFVGNDQQDAHEFITSLFDLMNQDIDKINKNTKVDILPIDVCFDCQINHTIKCTECGLERKSIEKGNSLSLDIPIDIASTENLSYDGINNKRALSSRTCKNLVDITPEEGVKNVHCPDHADFYMRKKKNRLTSKIVYKCDFDLCTFIREKQTECTEDKQDKNPGPILILEMLKKYFRVKTADFNCEECMNNKVVIESCFLKAPKILILHLKRFRFQASQDFGISNKDVEVKKLSNEIELSFQLDLVDFFDIKDRDCDAENTKYFLKCIIYHKGESSNSGHYICDVFNNKLNAWFTLDDLSVKRISEDDLTNPMRKKASYILFYEKRPNDD